jgi:hypothetical protein
MWSEASAVVVRIVLKLTWFCLSKMRSKVVVLKWAILKIKLCVDGVMVR